MAELVDNPFFARLWRPGGELRYLEHVASSGWWARLQKLANATIWPRLLGNCHTHRDTERSIVGAGFEVREARHEWVMPAWAPVPVSEADIGRAVRPTWRGQTGLTTPMPVLLRVKSLAGPTGQVADSAETPLT